MRNVFLVFIFLFTSSQIFASTSNNLLINNKIIETKLSEANNLTASEDFTIYINDKSNIIVDSKLNLSIIPGCTVFVRVKWHNGNVVTAQFSSDNCQVALDAAHDWIDAMSE